MRMIFHPTIRPVLMLALVPALALSAGCTTDITDPGDGDFEFVLGTITSTPRTSAVVTGDSLIVNIDTFGNTCRAKGELRLDLDRASRHVTVSPYDRFLLTERICLDIQLTFEHADTLRLSPGSWTVVFRGGSIVVPHRRVVTVEQTVEIPGAS